MSALGVILGTAAYMAPEQAKGKPLDKRVDIWAFGCVLYEMLTGQRAFAGEDVTDTLAADRRARIPTGRRCRPTRRRPFAGCCGDASRRIAASGCPTSARRGWS